MARITIGVVGGRGYVGRELVTLLERHEELEMGLMVSARDGLNAGDVAKSALDAYVLALPNGASAPYVSAIEQVRPDAVIVDLSADHRFDDGWVYGQPERLRTKIRGARRIANPGCYATAMQLALAPLVSLLGGPPAVFGVSGYSGAGTTPSPRNNPEDLRDNIMPYALVDHVHEREVSRQLGIRLFFSPHVASFFRGLTCTVSVDLASPMSRADVWERYREAYADETLVQLLEEAPLPRDSVGRHDVRIGGLAVSADGGHAVVVAALDNLLAGAATEALRNVNLALGLPECMGIVGEGNGLSSARSS